MVRSAQKHESPDSQSAKMIVTIDWSDLIVFLVFNSRLIRFQESGV
jgi:hypothetical protein